jgi:hypothetical protein
VKRKLQKQNEVKRKILKKKEKYVSETKRKEIFRKRKEVEELKQNFRENMQNRSETNPVSLCEKKI